MFYLLFSVSVSTKFSPEGNIQLSYCATEQLKPITYDTKQTARSKKM